MINLEELEKRVVCSIAVVDHGYHAEVIIGSIINLDLSAEVNLIDIPTYNVLTFQSGVSKAIAKHVSVISFSAAGFDPGDYDATTVAVTENTAYLHRTPIVLAAGNQGLNLDENPLILPPGVRGVGVFVSMALDSNGGRAPYSNYTSNPNAYYSYPPNNLSGTSFSVSSLDVAINRIEQIHPHIRLEQLDRIMNHLYPDHHVVSLPTINQIKSSIKFRK